MRTRKSGLLTVAFAAFLVVITISSVISWETTAATRQRISELHQAHLQSGAALGSIQADVYRSAVLVRDYLLDQQSGSGQGYASLFQDIQENTRRNFQVLRSSAGSDQGQRNAIDDLESKIRAYWDPTEIALDWTPEERAARRTHLLREKVKERQEITRLALDVQRLIANNFDGERDRVSEAERHSRVLFAWSTGSALIMGFAIAGLTLLRMRSLEQQSDLAQDELRRLSTELRTAQEDERKYLSRELHDQIGQMLTGLKLELTSLARRQRSEDADLHNGIDRAKSGVEQILGAVRNIAMLLRPSMLDDLGLTPAVRWHAKEFSRMSGMRIDCELDDEADLVPEPQRTCVYRVVQEALTNCARHSHAKHIEVDVKCDERKVSAAVSDNGVGFSTDAAHSGLGLIGIKERVRELNGAFSITSKPKLGTRLEVTLPFERKCESRNDKGVDSGRSRDCQDRIATAS